MRIDNVHFFQETAHCLYKSLSLEKSLSETYKHLKRHLPLDEMSLSIVDPPQRSLQYLARATDAGGLIIGDVVTFDPASRRETQNLIGDSFKVFEDSTQSPLCRMLGGYFGVAKPYSLIAMTVEVKQPPIGVIGLSAMGKNRFTKAHVQLLQSIKQLISDYIINLLHHREVILYSERLAIEKEGLRKRLGFVPDDRIIGAESGLGPVMDQVKRVAKTRSPVLLTGETGVGKEVIAHAIHLRSGRAGGPMVSVNCGAIPETLLESELFGFEKGAFTGAMDRKKGLFEQADGGTIFLDEVSELSLQAQVKLLRVLQEMKLNRIGGDKTISVDVRLIAATNRNLPDMVEQQLFRKDLWFRINVFPIRIPPLRERREDIPALARYFASQKAKEMNLNLQPRFAQGAINQLRRYDWPGNIRELQNIIERAIILMPEGPLSFPHLEFSPMDGIKIEAGRPGQPLPTLDEVVIGHIRKSLELCQGRIEGPRGAAKLICINPSTLRAKIRKYGIR